MRIKKGFLEITEINREREGPNANKAYPIPAATVIFAFGFFFFSEKSQVLMVIVAINDLSSFSAMRSLRNRRV